MAEIATYTMIKTKTSYGSTGTECPPKKIIKAISSYISIANESSYGDNEAVKLEDISATAYTFTVANNSKSIGAAGGITSAVDFTSYKIVNGVQSNVSYSLTSTLPSWLTWDSSTRKFTVANNLGSSRIFTATFTQAESGKTVTASVTQAAVSQTYTFTVDGGTSSSGVITKDGGESAAFNFVSTVTTNGTTTNVAYTLTSTLPSWLTWDSVNRRFTATANTGVERTATATFNQTNSGKAVTITIVQGEGDIVYVFTANPTVITAASAAGNTNSISIVSTKTPPGGSVTNVSYSIATGTLPGWLTWNAGGMNFSVTSNTSSSSRTAQVQFVQSESGNDVTITVTQEGSTYVDWRFNIGGETVVNDTIGSDGGTLTYYVTSTKDGVDHGFRLTTSSGFMTPTQTGSGSQNITITVSANTSTSSRTDFIEYRQYDSESTIRINITQSGKAEDRYVLQFTDGTTSAKSGTIPAKYSSNVNLISGGVESYKITSSGQEAVSYTYTKPSWITSVEIDGDMVLVTGFSENTSTSSRSGSIVITQSGSNNKLTINVTQSGKAADAYVFTVDGSTSTTKTASSSVGSVTVNVVSTKNGSAQGWTLTSSSQSWVHPSSTGNGSVALSINCDANEVALTSRTATIVYTQTGSGKQITITITQPPADGLIVVPSEASISSSSNSISCTVISIYNGATSAWTYDYGFNWYSAGGPSGNTFQISLYKNNGAARTGVVTFTQTATGKTATFTINQEGSGEMSTLSLESNDTKYNGPTNAYQFRIKIDKIGYSDLSVGYKFSRVVLGGTNLESAVQYVTFNSGSFNKLYTVDAGTSNSWDYVELVSVSPSSDSNNSYIVNPTAIPIMYIAEASCRLDLSASQVISNAPIAVSVRNVSDFENTTLSGIYDYIEYPGKFNRDNGTSLKVSGTLSAGIEARNNTEYSMKYIGLELRMTDSLSSVGTYGGILIQEWGKDYPVGGLNINASISDSTFSSVDLSELQRMTPIYLYFVAKVIFDGNDTPSVMITSSEVSFRVSPT